MFRSLSHNEDSTPQHSHRAVLPENQEDFQLIWLDAQIDDSPDSLLTRAMLIELNPAAQFYKDILGCENFIETTKDEKILLIISGAYASQNLTKIAKIRSVRAIFIFCKKREDYHNNVDQHSKVIGVFSNQKSLLESMKKTMHLLEKQTYVFNLFNQKQKSTRDLSKEGASFIWHQLLIHVLRQMKDEKYAKIDMLKKCADYYRHSKKELQNIERFRSTYSPEEAIYWYTKDSFIYKLLNKAFRTENIELIYAFRYFIIDLCAQLEQKSLKLEQNAILKLYRGQQIPDEEFDKLRKNVGKLIAPNGFFSTSQDKNVSVIYAGQNLNQMTAVLFEIQADPSLGSVTLADITELSEFKDEREVLFSIGATFKIDSIEFDRDLILWKVQLKSTDDGWERVQEHLKLAEKEMKDMSPVIYFGSLLLYELGQVDRAETYFNVLLKTFPSDHPDIAALNIGLGHIHTKQGHYRLALEKYQRAYEIRKEKLSILNPGIAASLRNFGNAYRAMGNFDQALIYFQEAMKINERNYSNDHISEAMTFEEMGLTFQYKAQWDTALMWFEYALEIFKRVLPSQHPQIAHCLGSIGNLYRHIGQYDCALEYLHQELEMDELCLPLDHCDVINDLTRLIDTYKMKHAYDQGLQFCQQKLSVYQELLSENHPRFVNTLLGIVSLLLKKSSIDEALQVCERALSIVTNIVPTNVPMTIECLEYISYIYGYKKDFFESLKYRQMQLEMEKKIYPPNHINIGWSLERIGNIYYDIKMNTEALSQLNEALTIYEGDSPRNNSIINTIRERINTIEKAQAQFRNSRKISPTRFHSSSRSRSRSKSGSRSGSGSRFYSKPAPISDQSINLGLSFEGLDLEIVQKQSLRLKPQTRIVSRKRNSRKK